MQGLKKLLRHGKKESADSLHSRIDPSHSAHAASVSRSPQAAEHHRTPVETTAQKAGSGQEERPASGLTSPLEKLTALLDNFHTTWLPMCNRFITSPPSDTAARDKEYKRLSEGVLAQVVLKADDIEIGGDPECRKMRKQIVDEANEIMKALDVVGTK